MSAGTMSAAWMLVSAAVVVVFYTYFGYPLILALWGAWRGRRGKANTTAEEWSPAEWPMLSITVPVYNEEAQIRGLIESLLALDYPAERRQILIVSDASTDRTDEIVAEYAAEGVELLRMPSRSGKTAAENAARPRLRGEIVINTDASIRIHPAAPRLLVSRFADPEVGVASARDVSVARVGADPNAGESGYVGYEMKVRELEDRVSGIIGASGCCYAIRADLHRLPLPEALSRDFAAALHAREHGYRATTVSDAICYVPRAGSLRREYRRKVRTMIRGMQTLHHKHRLLDPRRYGVFAWMLFSHKVCRWLVPWSLLGATLGTALLALDLVAARALLVAGIVGTGLALAGWYWPEEKKPPRLVSLPAYLLIGNLAAIEAAVMALRGVQNPTWEPTRREAVNAPATTHHGAGG